MISLGLLCVCTGLWATCDLHFTSWYNHVDKSVMFALLTQTQHQLQVSLNKPCFQFSISLIGSLKHHIMTSVSCNLSTSTLNVYVWKQCFQVVSVVTFVHRETPEHHWSTYTSSSSSPRQLTTCSQSAKQETGRRLKLNTGPLVL